MKPVPGADSTVDEAVAGNAQPDGRRRGAALPARIRTAALTGLNVLALCLAALLYLVVASLLALLIVRVGADLLDGIDPLLSEARRPRLFPRQIAMRELAVDIVRQVLLALLVLGTVRWRDGAEWRGTLGLERRAAPGLPPHRLLLILLAWPFLHILWVSATAAAFRAPFAHDVVLSPSLTAAALAAWLAYVVLLAPTAEELLMRGETFARARAVLGPAGAILLTALLFSLAHLSAAGLARPVSLLPLALMLGWLRWRTGRLWPCIALHGWSNLALVAYVLWP
ncbi:MAG TPA: type II CAAX endopeptidase family protein [Methylobacterium sp.]